MAYTRCFLNVGQKQEQNHCYMTAPLPSPTSWERPTLASVQGLGAQEEAHLPKDLQSKVLGGPTLPQLCTPPSWAAVWWAVPHGPHEDFLESMTRAKLLP